YDRLKDMKHKLSVIFACISALILVALIVVGLVSPGDKTDKSRRLFGASASVAEGKPEAAVREDTQEPAEEVSSEPVTETEPAVEITEEIEEPSEETEEPVSEEQQEQREILPKYNDLLQINPFIAGWLEIDDSAIDDPVVYTPKSQNYFLHRDIYGNDAEKGTFFIANNWQDGYNNTLIYGHNMKDGSGFGSLAKFAKKSYWESHPVIHFDTLFEEREYEVLAAFYSQIDEEELETDEDRKEADKAIEEDSIAKKEEEGEEVEPEELTIKDMDLYMDIGDVDIYRAEKDEDNGRFRYYYYTDLSDKEDFDYFVQNVKDRELYDTGVDAQWGDELITLSTCSYHVKNGRFILVGVRKK
ncbi:MAG: class B sortase, partial [Lachnospiraceae bacterium]|nr:class B sortase [Lachnospiraceae bacterium]